MSDEVQDPMSGLTAAAVTHHEMYTAWVEAGFTPDQALQLLMSIIEQIVSDSGGI